VDQRVGRLLPVSLNATRIRPGSVVFLSAIHAKYLRMRFAVREQKAPSNPAVLVAIASCNRVTKPSIEGRLGRGHNIPEADRSQVRHPTAQFTRSSGTDVSISIMSCPPTGLP